MAVIILKMLTDIFWYLAIMFPVILSVPLPVQILLSLIPVLWIFWLLDSRKKKDIAGGLQDILFLEGKILTAAVLTELVVLGADRWQKQSGGFVLLFLISGILMLRTGRISASGQSRVKFFGSNGICLSLILAAAMVLSLKPVREAFLLTLKTGYRCLILPVLLLLLRIMMKIFELLAPLFPEFQASGDMDTALDTMTGLEGELNTLEEVQAPWFLKAILILLAAGLLVLIFRYLYRRFTDMGDRRAGNNAGISLREQMGEEKKEEEERDFPWSERTSRYYYRKFLRLCRKKRLIPDGIVTSQAVQDSACRVWPEEELEKLRDSYLPVRYGNYRESREEKKRSRDVYRHLKELDEKTPVT